MGMLHRLMPVAVTKLADRVLEIAGSTEDKDRLGDIIRASGWKLGPFKKNPIFLWAHNYNSPPIGRSTRVWIDKATSRLMFNIEFAPPETYEFADTIYKLYVGGFLHATSVGFIPLDWEGKSEENPFPKWDNNVFTSQELLELSAVPVPANANALVTARDEGVITTKEFEAVSPVFTPQMGGLVLNPSEAVLGDKVDDLLVRIANGALRPLLMGTVAKPEETENQIRIPVKAEEGKHKDHTIKTIKIDAKKGITALYCGDCKVITTYLFDKDEGWTMATAQESVDEHSKSIILVDVTAFGDETFSLVALDESLRGITNWSLVSDGANGAANPEARTISQEQLRDDIDYLHKAIVENGMNEDTAVLAAAMAWEILERVPGADIPDDINQNGDNEPVEPLPVIDPQEEAAQRARDMAEVVQRTIAKLRGKVTK